MRYTKQETEKGDQLHERMSNALMLILQAFIHHFCVLVFFCISTKKREEKEEKRKIEKRAYVFSNTFEFDSYSYLFVNIAYSFLILHPLKRADKYAY